MDAAVAAVLSELDRIFTLREQRTALKAFLGGRHFHFSPEQLWPDGVKDCGPVEKKGYKVPHTTGSFQLMRPASAVEQKKKSHLSA